MAQKPLDHCDVHAPSKRQRREGVPQQVRMHMQPHPISDQSQHSLDCPRLHGWVRCLDAYKQGIPTLAPGDILLQHQLGPDTEIDLAALVALAMHDYAPIPPVDILHPDSGHLAQAASRRHKELYQRPLFIGFAGIPQPFQLLLGQCVPRPGAIQSGGLDLEHRISTNDAFNCQPAEEATQGIDVGQQTSVPQSAYLRQIGDVLPQIVHCDLGHRPVYLSRKNSQCVPVVFNRPGR